jgi:lysophospholipase L1-like esterase
VSRRRPNNIVKIAMLAVAAVAVLAFTAVALFMPRAQPEAAPDIQAKADAMSKQVADDMAASAKAEYEAKTVSVPFPKDRPLRYLLVGDSLANGAAATAPAKSFRELVGAGLGQHAQVEPVLAGKAGQGVELIAPQAIKSGDGFDVIVVEVGTNDAGKTDAGAFGSAYSKMITELRTQSPTAALVCLGAWRDEKMGAPYNAAIESACAAANGRYRSLSQHYSVAVNRWTTGIMSNGQPAEDNFHPSDTGHFEIASEVLNALRLDGKTS